MQTFQIKRLADAVREQTLDNLITELLLWLLDERVSLMDDGSQLLKALNVLMLKILVHFIFFDLFCFTLCPSRGCCVP
jgi:cytoskeleton-associated protein 5